MREDTTQTLPVREREPQTLTVTIEREHDEVQAMDDFFSDAPLDVESSVTGKACNIFDPDCEACQ